MTDIVLRAENLGKRYRLGQPPGLRSVLRRWLGWPTVAEAGDPRDFWALRDVSFDIARGQIVGVIGRNGAGKSTLLKILARITRPSAGRLEYQGRVSSLLEIGAGFHPDLTGRENIYLNGAILGMRRREIRRKFDEIVAFAEVEPFLDTPIKRYSSGMHVRLAFAVAAHLEPEILIIDEVLAVGDAGFQRKCLSKMSTVAGMGRTVLVVSHHLPTVLGLCDRCLLLDRGRLLAAGTTAEVVRLYQGRLHAHNGATDLRHVSRSGNGKAHFGDLQVFSRGPGGEEIPYLVSGHDLWVRATIEATHGIRDVNVAVVVYAPTGERLIDANLAQRSSRLTLAPGERARVGFHLQDVLLKPDLYHVGLWIGRAHVEDVDHVPVAGSFTVEADPAAIVGAQQFPGYYRCRFTEEVEVQPVALAESEVAGTTGAAM